MIEIDSEVMRFSSIAKRLAAEERVIVGTQFVAGEWRGSSAGATFDVISPTTERPIATVRSAAQSDVDDAVAAARSAFRSNVWGSMHLDARVEIIERVCSAIEEASDDIARVQTEQMGAPITGTRAGVARRVVANIQSNIRAARRLPMRFLVDDDEGVTVVERRPVGVVAAILPWNAPLAFEADKITAALLAGCTVVLKAAPEAPLEAFALATMFSEAGLPAGVLNVVAGAGDVGEMLVSHPDVARVTFTGSTATGRLIAAKCAARFARASLELGGKSAAIVLDDADLDRAASVIAGSNFGNAGQSCHAVTRVLVPTALHDDFVDRVRAIADGLVIGDPREPETRLGPLVSERQRARVEQYVALASDAGATVALGGRRPSHIDRGWFFEPTVLTDVSNDMRAAREEIFGPVMCVLKHDGDDQAIALANDSQYGLGGSVFSADPERGFEVARKIDTGMCAVNTWGMTRSAPFGGVKDSGMGREHGVWGVASCLETYAIRPDGGSLAGLGLQADGAIETVE